MEFGVEFSRNLGNNVRLDFLSRDWLEHAVDRGRRIQQVADASGRGDYAIYTRLNTKGKRAPYSTKTPLRRSTSRRFDFTFERKSLMGEWTKRVKMII